MKYQERANSAPVPRLRPRPAHSLRDTRSELVHEKAPQIMMAPPPLCRVENISGGISLEAIRTIKMPSDGYWAAVSTSNGLNLGRGSTRIVLTDSHSDPPAQRR
ncbi:unnamed protein product [Pleuronectes platessa]|uniref:Uncharacterized protein n=1 Tax=Pleuronectes platessa TaxID=8262 RepID=A0A9N7YFQ5_PLEPL|nr:unnamed protein product [Pleuronectes platessa]